MDTREWALLAFTILGQTAAGLMIIIMVVRAYIARKTGNQSADQLTNRALYWVVPIMAVAFLASLLHLGSPMNILGALPNLGTSWLSREVIIGVAFVVFAVLYTFLQWRKTGSAGIRNIIGWITAVLAVAYVYAMSMVYMIPTQPSWNTLATPLMFLTGSLLLGALAMAMALVSLQAGFDGQASELSHTILKGLAITSIILLGIQFVVLPVYMAYLSTQGTAALESLNMMINSYGALLAFRLFLIFAGAGVLAVYLYRDASILGKEEAMVTLAYSSFFLVLFSEVLGRFIFYATHYRIGV